MMIDISNKCEGDESQNFIQKARDIANSFYGYALIAAMTTIAAASLYCAKPAYGQKAEAAEASIEQTKALPTLEEEWTDLGRKKEKKDILGNFPGPETSVHLFENESQRLVVYELPNGQAYSFSIWDIKTRECLGIYWSPFNNQQNYIPGTRIPPEISLESYGYKLDKVSQK